MIFATPPIEKGLRAKLAGLDRLRRELGGELGRATPWMGALRRVVAASSVEGSTSIEGYSVSPAEAIALLGGEVPGVGKDESRLAVACYARAMDHVSDDGPETRGSAGPTGSSSTCISTPAISSGTSPPGSGGRGRYQ